MTWFDFVVLVLAAQAVVDVWFNGSIFANVFAQIQDKAYPPELLEDGSMTITDGPAGFWYRYTPRLLAKLLSCWFCFSHHTPWVLIVLLYLPASYLAEPWRWIALVPFYSLAATRCGTIINKLFPQVDYERGTTSGGEANDN